MESSKYKPNGLYVIKLNLVWRFSSIYVLFFEVCPFKWKLNFEKFIHQLVILFVVVLWDDGSGGNRSRVREVKLSMDTQPVSVSNWHTNVWD